MSSTRAIVDDPWGLVFSDWAAHGFAGRAGSVRPLNIRDTRSTYVNVTAPACRTNRQAEE